MNSNRTPVTRLTLAFRIPRSSRLNAVQTTPAAPESSVATIFGFTSVGRAAAGVVGSRMSISAFLRLASGLVSVVN
jgi:hypothetical protein